MDVQSRETLEIIFIGETAEMCKGYSLNATHLTFHEMSCQGPHWKPGHLSLGQGVIAAELALPGWGTFQKGTKYRYIRQNPDSIWMPVVILTRSSGLLLHLEQNVFILTPTRSLKPPYWHCLQLSGKNVLNQGLVRVTKGKNTVKVRVAFGNFAGGRLPLTSPPLICTRCFISTLLFCRSSCSVVRGFTSGTVLCA